MKTYSRKAALGEDKIEAISKACNNNDGNKAISKACNDDSKATPVKRTKITDFFFREPGAESKMTNFKKHSSEFAEKPNQNKKSAQSSLRQTFLDLGQRDLFLTSCDECGLKYDRSFPEDVKRHAVEHQRLNLCFEFSKYKEKQVWKEEFSNGDSIVKLKYFKGCLDLIDRVNNLLDAVNQSLEEIQSLSMLLYVRHDKVVGVMTTEPIQTAFREDSDGKRHECTALIGVSRIWVLPELRRKGIATKLLKSLRQCNHQSFIQCKPECSIASDQVAFSQPTTQGKVLAVNFLNSSGDHVVYV